ncbi:MAG: hypothetical protein WC391_05060 [Methanoregula sp.]|jgi:hypothetical protein
MKEAREVFDDSLKSIEDMLNANNLKGCYMLSNYLTTFAHMSDYPDAQFISEVLEGIFSQVGPVLEEPSVIPSARENAIKLLKTPFHEIVQTYNGDKMKLYNALKNMRFQATGIQLMCWKGTINSELCEEKSE